MGIELSSRGKKGCKKIKQIVIIGCFIKMFQQKETCFTLVLVSRDAYNQNCKTCSTCVEGSFCINGNATGNAGVKGLLPNDFFLHKGKLH